MGRIGAGSKGKYIYLGIRILEVVWKVVEAVIDTRIKSVVQFYNVLHRFCAGGGAGTAILEIKLAQELESVDQDTLFLLFLDLSKSYYNLYQGRLLQTLEGYGVRPKLRGLIVEFWLIREVVTRQNGFGGPQLRETRGTTHGW